MYRLENHQPYHLAKYNFNFFVSKQISDSPISIGNEVGREMALMMNSLFWPTFYLVGGKWEGDVFS